MRLGTYGVHVLPYLAFGLWVYITEVMVMDTVLLLFKLGEKFGQDKLAFYCAMPAASHLRIR